MLRYKFDTVETEYRLGTTTADVYFVDDRNPILPQRVAIEAKDYNKPLRTGDLARIDLLYRSALSSHEIDYLWIISNHALASIPARSLKSMANILFMTKEQFRLSLMNFSNVIRYNKQAFDQSTASKNFLHARAKDKDVPLIDEVRVCQTVLVP